MKLNKIILEFREDFKKLNYDKNEMTVRELEGWADTWCGEKPISKNLYINFRTLALAYAKQEIEENYLTSALKEKRE